MTAEEVCAEAYQAVGFLADALGFWQMDPEDPRAKQITKLLDNLVAGAEGDAVPHTDLLPFGWPIDWSNRDDVAPPIEGAN